MSLLNYLTGVKKELIVKDLIPLFKEEALSDVMEQFKQDERILKYEIKKLSVPGVTNEWIWVGNDNQGIMLFSPQLKLLIISSYEIPNITCGVYRSFATIFEGNRVFTGVEFEKLIKEHYFKEAENEFNSKNQEKLLSLLDEAGYPNVLTEDMEKKFIAQAKLKYEHGAVPDKNGNICTPSYRFNKGEIFNAGSLSEFQCKELLSNLSQAEVLVDNIIKAENTKMIVNWYSAKEYYRDYHLNKVYKKNISEFEQDLHLNTSRKIMELRKFVLPENIEIITTKGKRQKVLNRSCWPWSFEKSIESGDRIHYHEVKQIIDGNKIVFDRNEFTENFRQSEITFEEASEKLDEIVFAPKQEKPKNLIETVIEVSAERLKQSKLPSGQMALNFW